jgi:hypothetical protein
MTVDEIYLLILFIIFLILFGLGLLIWLWRIYTKTSRPGSVGTPCTQCDSHVPSIVENAQVFSSEGFEIEPEKIQCGETYYIACSASEITVPNCADGTGYLGVISKAKDCAMDKALIVASACAATHPDCNAVITQEYLEWFCSHYTHTLPGPMPPDTVAEAWLKGAIVHLKVVCQMSF